jgi:hypothetical protein
MLANELLIPISLFLSAFGMFYIYFKTRHKERMFLIEKGADPALFQARKDNGYGTMRVGMFLVGIALGILTGNILSETTLLKEEVAYFSMIFLFGGLSLVIYYIFIEKKNKKNIL